MQDENTQIYPGRALGKLPPVNKVALTLDQFLITKKVEYPIYNAAPQLVYPMDDNDTTGVCAVAGFDHFNQLVDKLLLNKDFNFSKEDRVKMYQTQNPNFNPNGTAETNGPGSSADRGMNLQIFLEWLATNKYIIGFGRVNFRDVDEFKSAIYIGLGVYTGVVLTEPQMGDQFNKGIWDYVKGAKQVGGHCIPFPGYVPDLYDCITWARIIKCTQSFIDNQMDEAWFILTQAHIDHPEFRNHFDLQGFADAVYQITDGKVIVPVPKSPTTENPTLRLTRPLTQGPAVRNLQSLLGITTDGYFGKQTKAAVIRFQISKGLTADGIVGPQTWAALLQLPAQKKSLLDAQIQVESGGNDNAIGDKGLKDHAYGCLQIRKPVCSDVNARFGTHYKPEDALNNRALSIEIWTKYLSIYATTAHLGHAPTDEDRARMWNGGPSGYKESATLGYWKLVQDAMIGKTSTPLSEQVVKVAYR